jgi:hypothetical protein
VGIIGHDDMLHDFNKRAHRWVASTVFLLVGYKGGEIYWLAIHSNQANLIVGEGGINSVESLAKLMLGCLQAQFTLLASTACKHNLHVSYWRQLDASTTCAAVVMTQVDASH